MALKKQISKADYDNLPAAFKTEYRAQGEDFVLDIEGEDTTDWKKKRDIEAEHRRNAEARATAAENERDEMRRGAIPKADVEALENSWKAKVTTAEQAGAARVAELETVIATTTADTAARDVASMFLAPAAMIPMVRSRLKPEIVGGVAVTRVLDKNGQPSALTLDDLKAEFKADPTLAPVIVASKASGAGASGGQQQPGGPGAGGKKLKDMGDAERLKLYRENKPEFDRLVAEQKNS